MFWEEETTEEQYVVPDDVVDMLFRIDCPTLPVDHAWALSREILEHLPWFSDTEGAGLHIIHGADSGNGWERPQGRNELLHLSRRTRLTLRLPRDRVDDASVLTGKTLRISGHSMRIAEAKTRRLGMTSILYSRYLVSDPEWSDDDFIQWAVSELKALRLRFKKVLSGRAAQIATPNGAIPTRTLMVANMPFEDAVMLQERGLGPHRALGCGLFIPQKDF